MDQSSEKTRLARRSLIGAVALLVCAQPAWAVLGHWRRVARRTTVVVASTASAESAAAAQQTAANSAKASADASAAAAKQSEAAAQQAEAQAKADAQPASSQSAQVKLKDLKSLYDQKLISASDYEAAKTKILNEMAE